MRILIFLIRKEKRLSTLPCIFLVSWYVAHLIRENNEEATMNLLLKYSATPNVVDEYGLSPLYLACTNNSVVMTKTLLLHNADPNFPKQKKLPLGIAVVEKNMDIMKLLLNYKADPCALNAIGVCSLHVAATTKDLTSAKLLLDYTKNINVTRASNGDNCAHIACKNDDLKMLQLLAKQNINLSATNVLGNTPLHEAAQANANDCALYLTLKTSDARSKNKSGKTPYGLASKEVASKMLETGKSEGSSLE
jgi:ankyrin repeat protein